MKVINRIKASKDFAETIKKGTALRNSSFVIHFKANELDYTRIGISVSTKLGHAVVRNRIKRQIRAMCDSSIDYASHTFDIVIIAKEGFLKCDYHENIKLLNILLSKIGNL